MRKRPADRRTAGPGPSPWWDNPPYAVKFSAGAFPPRDFLRALDRRFWPGNVRELENMAEKYVTRQGVPTDPDFPYSLLGQGGAEPDETGAGEDGDDDLDAFVRRHVRAVLRKVGGNISRAARQLGVSRNTAKRWLG
jgi:transcriptional regulator with PAS, ATPase and Fis domain